jgi:tRNA(Ile)-lysidine synthase
MRDGVHRPNRSVPAAYPDLSIDFSPLGREHHVALAVSGGSDSIALMHLATAWAASHRPGLMLSILTVDHGLRLDSAQEARRVGGWAGQLGLPHHVLAWEGGKPQTGLQAKAREARYGLMAQWCRENGAGLLLTGHTLDDQAETVLMRLDRSMSPGSLAAIAMFGDWRGLCLFRPLLGTRRQALRDYLTAQGQPWVEDASNADRRFERVRIREAMADLPARGITPERLAALAEASARTSLLLDRLTTQWLTRWLTEEEAGICYLPKQPFVDLPDALKQHILARVLRHYGGGQSPPEREELRRLVAWVDEGPVRCTLGGNLVGRRKSGFWVTREAGRISPKPLVIPPAGSAIWDGRFHITAAPGARVTAGGQETLAPGRDVPAYVRRAYPLVAQPDGTGDGVGIAFLRLVPV